MHALTYALVFMPMAAAGVSFGIGRVNKKLRDIFVVLCALAEVAMCVMFAVIGGHGETLITLPGVCGFGLNFTTGGFRSIYALIACMMWLVTGIFSPEYFAHYRNRNRYYLFWLLTLGATVGIFLSADLYTTFVFFEMMSLASYVWVAQDESAGSLKAGETYLAVAVIGGLVMLMGIFLLYHQTGTLMVEALPKACEGKNLYAAALCMFVGFGAKAGAYPIHIWLPKAHPVAPAPASALLSGILTKTGIYGILVISVKMLSHDAYWGTFVLLIGVITMFLGALLAAFSVNFKRTLACSSVSQIGFILVGVGMMCLLGHHNTLAARGSFLHMVNHSLFKLILFLVAAVIYQNTHKLHLNDIRGFGRKKPVLMLCYLFGALGIGGIPGFSGYVSKTLLHESIVEYMELLHHGEAHGLLSAGVMSGIEWIFLLSGGLTVCYMTKLFVAVFVQKNKDPEVQAKYDAKTRYAHPVSMAALAACAVTSLVMGSLPHGTMDKLADMASHFLGAHLPDHAVHYFAWVNLKGGLISIGIGAVLYLVVVRNWMHSDKKGYIDRWPAFIDLEEKLYRPVITKLLPAVLGGVCAVMDGLFDFVSSVAIKLGSSIAGVFDIVTDSLVVFLRRTIYRDSPMQHELEEGNALTHAVGKMLNRIEDILNKTIWKKREHKVDFEHRFVLWYSAFKENSTVIGRSLSFGLMLFSLGLCLTLIYLLVSSLL